MKAGPLRPAGIRRKPSFAQLLLRERPAADAGDPQFFPFRDRPAVVGAFQRAGHGLRHGDLEPPVATLHPAMVRQVAGDRGQRVGHRLPDVGPPIGVEVHRVPEKRGRQELRLAERARPGRLHGVTAGKPALQHGERRQHLLAEHLPARRHESLRAEHLESVVGDFRRAEAGFSSPDGQHDPGRHAEALLDGGKRPGMVGGAGTGAGGDGAHRLLGEIEAGRAEFRLMLLLRRFRPGAWHDQVGQVEVRPHPGESGSRRSFFQIPAALGFGPQVVLQPIAEPIVDPCRGSGNRDDCRGDRKAGQARQQAGAAKADERFLHVRLPALVRTRYATSAPPQACPHRDNRARRRPGRHAPAWLS